MKTTALRLSAIVAMVILLGSTFESSGFDLSRIVGTQTMLIRHKATEEQMKVAQARAKVYYTRLAPEKKTALKQKKVRYIAVDTVRSKDTSPKAKKVVMVWDTQAENVVGNDVYDLTNPPAVGQTAKFDAYSAEYVGTGS
jgi:hypothetical protein